MTVSGVLSAMAFLPPMKGLGSAIPPSPSASASRRVSRVVAIASPLFALQLPRAAGGRSLRAVFQPLGEFWHGRHVDLRRPRPGEDAGDIKVGDREIVTEQVRGAAERPVEHPERLGER